MWTSDDMMLVRINKELFVNSRVPPEDEYYSISFCRQSNDHSICEVFPSLSLMTSWLSLPHSQYSVEKKDSLLSPVSEICKSSLDSDIWVQFFEYISETWLWFATFWNRECKTHSSTSRMIWILPEDHNTYIVEMGQLKSFENTCFLRKANLLRIFAFYKISEYSPVRFLKFSGKSDSPRWWKRWEHSMSIEKKSKKSKKSPEYSRKFWDQLIYLLNLVIESARMHRLNRFVPFLLCLWVVNLRDHGMKKAQGIWSHHGISRDDDMIWTRVYESLDARGSIDKITYQCSVQLSISGTCWWILVSRLPHGSHHPYIH